MGRRAGPVEGLVILHRALAGRRVLVTGHTGFKGAWLCEWLLTLGAQVRGFALEPPTNPSLFNQLELASRLDDIRGDIRDAELVRREILAWEPEVVFHLAAQPLVRQSYRDPIETYRTNVMGTIHVLDAMRRLAGDCVGVMVTTDKCYDNREWIFGYREIDPMGGADPYSSSKGMAELAISAYRRSFLHDSGVRVASARAGNVIGGGDWAEDRMFPDCMRALSTGQVISVRNPKATRPWQHVLEPLHGYLLLASALLSEQSLRNNGEQSIESAFNFGPSANSNRSVGELVEEVLAHWPGRWEDRSDATAVHEARLLRLNIDKATSLLKWQPTWEFSRTIAETVDWYRSVLIKQRNALEITVRQIKQYEQDLEGTRYEQ